MIETIMRLVITAVILYGCVFHSSGTTLAYILCGIWLFTILGLLHIFTSLVKDVIGYHE